MIENAKLYKEISLDIVKAIDNEDIAYLDSLFEKRQLILNETGDSEQFKNTLIGDGILDIDKKIQSLLRDNIDKVKQEIKEYKLSKNANNSYINFSKEKLNIFNKKV